MRAVMTLSSCSKYHPPPPPPPKSSLVPVPKSTNLNPCGHLSSLGTPTCSFGAGTTSTPTFDSPRACACGAKNPRPSHRANDHGSNPEPWPNTQTCTRPSNATPTIANSSNPPPPSWGRGTTTIVGSTMPTNISSTNKNGNNCIWISYMFL